MKLDTASGNYHQIQALQHQLVAQASRVQDSVVHQAVAAVVVAVSKLIHTSANHSIQLVWPHQHQALFQFNHLHQYRPHSNQAMPQHQYTRASHLLQLDLHQPLQLNSV
jgi:hypothetical protein